MSRTTTRYQARALPTSTLTSELTRRLVRPFVRLAGLGIDRLFALPRAVRLLLFAGLAATLLGIAVANGNGALASGLGPAVLVVAGAEAGTVRRHRPAIHVQTIPVR